MIGIRFAAPEEQWHTYKAPLHVALSDAGLTFHLSPDLPAQDTDYIVYAPNDHMSDFSLFPKLKLVLSLWAGVERIVTNPTLTVPLTRMADDGLRQGMTEWVLGHVLRHHLGLDAHAHNPKRQWDNVAPPLAQDRIVAMLGLGNLGQAAARALRQVGFQVRGWSRRPSEIAGIDCFAGRDGLTQALSGAHFVVTLLPQTPETENILNAESLSCLSRGAYVLNPGRGTLIDDDALLEAVSSGHIGHATLDVFRTEPLPQDHPFWACDRITVTPHIAAETRPSSASALIADNIRRKESGEPLLHLVDRSSGY